MANQRKAQRKEFSHEEVVSTEISRNEDTNTAALHVRIGRDVTDPDSPEAVQVPEGVGARHDEVHVQYADLQEQVKAKSPMDVLASGKQASEKPS